MNLSGRIESVGVFGGSFDPPHQGHLILAAEAHFQLSLERVLWVLTPQPPHKSHQLTPLSFRLEMLHAAIQDNPIFELSSVEMNRPGPHYAVDTMRALSERYPGIQLIYLMGGDSLRDLPTWHRRQEFVDVCGGIGVMRRPGDHIDLAELETVLLGISAKVHFVEAPLLEISSQELRRRIGSGEPVRYYLPPPVEEIIRRNNLYRNGRISVSGEN